jgi:hypothetical protein
VAKRNYQHLSFNLWLDWLRPWKQIRLWYLEGTYCLCSPLIDGALPLYSLFRAYTYKSSTMVLTSTWCYHHCVWHVFITFVNHNHMSCLFSPYDILYINNKPAKKGGLLTMLSWFILIMAIDLLYCRVRLIYNILWFRREKHWVQSW